MITIEELLLFGKNDLQEVSKTISKDDLPQLVEWLSEIDNSIRYQALLLLQCCSTYSADVYPFWNTRREEN